MNKLTWLAVGLTLSLSVAALAGEAKKEEKKATKAQAYVCAHCKMAADKAGNCPACKSKLEACDACYACDKCGAESAKAGNCPKCKVAMTKKAAMYHCDGCKKDFAKAGT